MGTSQANKKGWIKLYRSIQDWKWFYDDAVLRGWIYLLVNANSEDGEWNGLEVKRGQIVVSISSLAESLKVSVQQARRVLKALKSTHDIVSVSTNKFTLISICEYESYQSGGKKGQQANQQANQQAVQQALEQQLLRYKSSSYGCCETAGQQAEQQAGQQEKQQQLKNNKEDIRKLTTVSYPPLPPLGFVSQDFADAFALWLEYKRQKGQTYKGEASMKACYNKLVRLSGGNPETAMAIVEQSMANNWAGLFALKDENNGQQRQNNGFAGQPSDPRVKTAETPDQWRQRIAADAISRFQSEISN